MFVCSHTAVCFNVTPSAQVDLESPKKVSGIITQGAKDFGSVQFVTAFKVAHSDDGQSWTTVKDETTRTDKVGPDSAQKHVHRCGMEMKRNSNETHNSLKHDNHIKDDA